MQIHRVRGASLREALLRAQNEHGDDAIVIQQELVPGGGVTLSVARRSIVAPNVASTRASSSLALATVPAELAAPFDPFATPLVREVALRLQRTGTSSELIAAVCREALDGDPALHVMDRAASAIGKRFEVARAPKLRDGARILAFVGLTGVGKTTTLVKLAARMLRAGRRVELATLDSRRVGAVEQLRAWSKTLGVPLSVLGAGAKPHARARQGVSGVDAVLLDTSGNPARDAAALKALEESFTGARVSFGTWLVLPATASRAALELVTRSYADLDPEGVVITKLDETREPAVALEHALDSKLPIAFLTDGPDVEEHLHRSGPEACADLLLRGRLA